MNHCAAALSALARDVYQGRLRLSGAEPQHLANLANAWAKCAEQPDCAQALASLARGVHQGRLRLGGAEPQALANLANAWAKCAKQADCAQALASLARDLHQGRLRLGGAEPQHLANLANAWAKCPGHADCAEALASLARDLHQGRLRLAGAEPQNLANLANAWAKCTEQPDCAQALASLARGVHQGQYPLANAEPQHLANLANAWAKCAEQPDCAQALASLARDVHQGHHRLAGAKPHELANLTNAWGKCPRHPDCAQALASLARGVHQGHYHLGSAKPQDLANLANAWAKCTEQADCALALAGLARGVHQGQYRLAGAEPQHLANLANAWAKCTEQPDCAEALASLARDVHQGRLRLAGAEPQASANLANAWAKCTEQPDCARALASLARDVHQGRLRLAGAEPQHLANLANAWAKCPEHADCALALAGLARGVHQGRLRLAGAGPQHLANLANAWAKCPEHADCALALASLGRDMHQGRLRLAGAEPQHLANLANAWAKCARQPDCAEALASLAREVYQGRQPLAGAESQALANLANAWAKCAGHPDCRAAIDYIAAQALGGDGPAFADADIRHVSLLAHALSRNALVASAADGEGDIASRSHQHLTDLTLRLEETPATFATAETQSLALLLRALGQAGLRDERRRLVPSMLERLGQLHSQARPFASVTLETFGHLCIGLRPLALQNLRKQRTLRGEVLQALDRLQPFIARALAQQSASTADIRQSLLPAVSTRYVLETYSVVAHTLRPRNLPRAQDGRHTGKALAERRQALSHWLKAEEARLRPLFEGSVDVSLWDLQARLRAPGTSSAGTLDRLVAERASAWQAKQPASVFDVRQALAAMDHPPHTPSGQMGLYRPARIDVRGKPLGQPGDERYYVLTHLTHGKLPFAVVELGNAPSLSVLERPITFNDQTWRSDVVGGSRMKKGQLRTQQLMKAEGERPGGPQLLALRLSETLPGSAYDDLARSLMPAREDFFRFQRMFLSSPPQGIPGLKPQDHVLEGTFRIGILPDRAGQHSFRFNDAQGRPIALQPHDGCGFVRQSLLARMPACQMAWGHGAGGKPAQPLPPYAAREPGHLPGQALQHYPLSDAVATEVREQLGRQLADRPMEHERLFRAVTTGLIQGLTAIAVPSADGRVHLSSTKAADFLRHGGGVLIGRSPYDKPNLRPFTANQVATAEQNDPTATFLDRCTTLQYSYVGDQAQPDGGNTALFASKGLMVGIPDDLWPQAFSNTDIVMSAQDIKTHSAWKAGKQRVEEDTLTRSRGLLVVNEILMPGSLIAMPRAEQQRLDGDFDGDTVLIVAGRPKLFEHVRLFDAQMPRPPVLKPAKTHSTPFDANDDHYQHGRSEEILPVYAGVLEHFSMLQTRYLAQPQTTRDTIAARMLYGAFEGLPKGWKRQTRAALEGDTITPQHIEALHQALLEQQRKAPARRAPARAMEAELLRQLEALHTPQASGMAVEHARPLPVLPGTDEIAGMAALREEYPAATTPAERIRVLLSYYPERQLSSRVGYECPDDAQQCLQNLLSLGIKAGTDAYKSQTGVYPFSVLGRRLDRLLRTQGPVVEVPYTKGTARRLANKRFDADKARRELANNPTLAAAVMRAALDVPAVQQALHEQKPDMGPGASDRQQARMLATELEARAGVHYPRVAQTLEQALKTAGGGMLFDRNQEHKGRESMLDKILRRQQAQPTNSMLQAASNVNDALRFYVQLDERDFVRQYRAIIDALDKGDTRRLRTRNCFTLGANARYKGINVTRCMTANGETVPFEIQFHTPQSRTVKHQTHAIYKDAQRRQLRGSQNERIEELEETMRQRWRNVPAPPQVQSIGNSGGDWPEGGLWNALTGTALPDEPLDEEDEAQDEDE
ncbi:hypothetical protein [Pseudomonas typographi]|uniref:hypothetical protein n=1 Tax=Pseudomonas typographi TaxID=2715964 RepID=UPI00168226EB|nr:hypothetical protein [Pseudomonas typographi]MBD1554876.1 hypothetical protein [Pseudomonas typographi]